MTSNTARAINSIGEYATLIFRVIGVTLRRPPTFRQIRDQMFEIGVMSLPSSPSPVFSRDSFWPLKPIIS